MTGMNGIEGGMHKWLYGRTNGWLCGGSEFHNKVIQAKMVVIIFSGLRAYILILVNASCAGNVAKLVGHHSVPLP